jgi:hypothetical protein
MESLCHTPKSSYLIALFAVFASITSVFGAESACKTTSAATVTPVIELYTSEGCSSCPPSDQWLSTLKAPTAQGHAVVQAFHVAYWDYIGWVDRFANPAHTVRQKHIARLNGLPGIYTPQWVRDGQDWKGYERMTSAPLGETSRTRNVLQRTGTESFEAMVAPSDSMSNWSAYWSVTEHGHSSKVKAGEHAGEYLKHDFVVRQYVPVGDYKGPKTLTFNNVPGTPEHARQVNLVVFDGKTGKTMQALSLSCQG